MNKIFIVLLFILLGTSLIVIMNIKGTTDNSFNIVYENNKNVVLPDLTNDIEIINGLYRIYDSNGITIDYNVYNGIYTINGTVITSPVIYFTNEPIIQPLEIVSMSMFYVSGSTSGNFNWLLGDIGNFAIKNYTVKRENVFTTENSTNNTRRLRIYLTNGTIFDNYQIKLQLEKGSQVTNYVVPKLIPIYKDNLTYDEKQQIGMGAFEGIPKIIRTINNILKPVTDFVNGLLSIFS